MALGDPLWIFGYGSLVWRPAFPFAERRPAWIAGFERRFWQGSTDHRGVPGAPGRVVTLVRAAAGRCWGMAYRIAPGERAAVLARLDVREQGGYQRLEVDVHFELDAGSPDAGAPAARALAWLATPANRNYLGPALPGAIAAQVRRSHGPSGANLDYVLRLAAALREMEADDPHVFEIETLLREGASDAA